MRNGTHEANRSYDGSHEDSFDEKIVFPNGTLRNSKTGTHSSCAVGVPHATKHVCIRALCQSEPTRAPSSVVTSGVEHKDLVR